MTETVSARSLSRARHEGETVRRYYRAGIAPDGEQKAEKPVGSAKSRCRFSYNPRLQGFVRQALRVYRLQGRPRERSQSPAEESRSRDRGGCLHRPSTKCSRCHFGDSDFDRRATMKIHGIRQKILRKYGVVTPRGIPCFFSVDRQ